LEESTLRKRLSAGESANKVVIEELPRWNKAGSKVLEGLVNRRKDEVALFVGSQQTEQRPGRVRPTSPFTAHVTPNIQLGEFALYKEERRFAADYQVAVAAELAAFLERVRVQFGGKPVIITSGYRPKSINRMVNGASSSEHLFSKPNEGAVDFWVKDVDMMAVQRWCDKEWPYSLGYAAPNFIHLGRRADGQRRRWNYA